MSDDYDPTHDAIALLETRSPIARHAFARLLDPDAAIGVLGWLIDQPDCDAATAAMIFWRLSVLPSAEPTRREAVVASILERAAAGRYAARAIAWDGSEAWARTPLADRAGEPRLPAALRAPFGTAVAEPVTLLLLDHPAEDEDIFDSLWSVPPVYVGIADWLAGRSPEIWLATVDALAGSHPDAIYEWMVEQPECPSSVAGLIFWNHAPAFDAQRLLDASPRDRRRDPGQPLATILARWREGSFAPCDLDFSRRADPVGYRALLARHPGRDDPLDVPADLLDPAPGRETPPLDPRSDFLFWCLATSIGSIVPRDRDAAVAEWRAWLASRHEDRPRVVTPAADGAPGLLDRLFYGGAFTGTQAQRDRCWRQFNLVVAGLTVLLLALMRGGAPLILPFSTFLLLVAVISVYLSSAQMGGARRLVPWWIGALLLVAGLTMLFRWIDRGGFA